VANVRRRAAEAPTTRSSTSRHDQHPLHLRGAFVGLDKIIGADWPKAMASAPTSAEGGPHGEAALDRLEPEDLIRYGLIPSSSAAAGRGTLHS